MRSVLLLLVLATPAVAQPVTTPSRCEVTISRAPDDVREAIEAWVQSEQRCTTSLDLRVIPTDGGFYLFARDDNGHVRERVVPDAQSAGVLVASWIADDGIVAPPPPAEPEIPEPTPPALTPPVISKTVITPPRREGRWLTVGGIVQMHGGGAGGLRAEIDLVHRGRWTLGAVVAGSSADLDTSAGYVSTVDLRALAAITRRTPLGARWTMRLSIGAGVLSTYASGELGGDDIAAHGVFPTAEASAMFSRELRGGWALAAGPIVTWYSQTYKYDDTFTGMQTLTNRGLELMAFGGVRRRL